LVRDADSGRAAQQRGEQVAASGERVVEVDALSREQQRSVEAGIDQRLRAEPLSDRGRRLAPCRTSRGECQTSCNKRRGKQEDRSGEQAAQTPVRASECAAALLKEVPLDPVQARVVPGG